MRKGKESLPCSFVASFPALGPFGFVIHLRGFALPLRRPTAAALLTESRWPRPGRRNSRLKGSPVTVPRGGRRGCEEGPAPRGPPATGRAEGNRTRALPAPAVRPSRPTAPTRKRRRLPSSASVRRQPLPAAARAAERSFRGGRTVLAGSLGPGAPSQEGAGRGPVAVTGNAGCNLPRASKGSEAAPAQPSLTVGRETDPRGRRERSCPASQPLR